MKIARPDYTESSLVTQTSLESEEDLQLENVRLQDIDMGGMLISGLDMRESAIESCIFMQANLDKVQMMDVAVKSTDMSAAKCADGSFIRASFMKSRMNGLNVSKSTLRDVTLKGCQLDLANFRFAKLLRVRFEDCTLTEADFMGVELNQVEFNGCTIDRTVFDQVKVKAADFSGSNIIALSGWNSLRSATIDSVQLAAVAPQIVSELGIRVV